MSDALHPDARAVLAGPDAGERLTPPEETLSQFNRSLAVRCLVEPCRRRSSPSSSLEAAE